MKQHIMQTALISLEEQLSQPRYAWVSLMNGPWG